jgi:hypothetical protein
MTSTVEEEESQEFEAFEVAAVAGWKSIARRWMF